MKVVQKQGSCLDTTYSLVQKADKKLLIAVKVMAQGKRRMLLTGWILQGGLWDQEKYLEELKFKS